MKSYYISYYLPTDTIFLLLTRKTMTEPITYDPKKEMTAMMRLYLASNPAVPDKRKTSELEIRFRGFNGAPISKTDYENVVQHLKFSGFVPESAEGVNMLRVQPQYKDTKTGTTRLSNIRAEIKTTKMIQEYCRTNSIQSIISTQMTSSHLNIVEDKLLFTQKTPIPVNANDPTGPKIRPVDFKDLNFRLAYQYERIYNENSELVRGMIEQRAWADSKKVFRHMNRVRFSHPDYPLFVDMSILRTSPKSGNIMIPYYTVQDANLFDSPVSYEVEVEIDNMRVGPSTAYNKSDDLIGAIRKVSRIIMSALQQTNYPIGNVEYKSIQHGYLRLIHGAKYEAENHYVLPRDFTGPSSKTLQLENLVDDAASKVPCVREGYTVTDKADGDRKLLYISESGKLYFIDTNMRIQFTGARTKEKKMFASMFDGEHIKFDKNGKYINLYAAFDVYYVNKKSMREYSFLKTTVPINESDMNEEAAQQPTRLEIMNMALGLIQPEMDAKPIELAPVEKIWTKWFSESKRAYYWFNSKTSERHWDGAVPPNVKALIDENIRESERPQTMSCPFRIQAKQFYTGTDHPGTGGQTIFQCCDKILNTMFEYNTDGLIFTPAKYGVGGNENQIAGPLTKVTWGLSFKWKPAEYNTVDFLVRVKKDETGKDIINVSYDESNRVQQYKTLVLYVGYDEKMHGYYNPFEQLLKGEYKVASRNEAAEDDDEAVSKYMAKPFIPSDPFDDRASLCNIHIDTNYYKEDANAVMYTEDGQPFEENMIVEFRYDMERTGAWRWVPIRVRHDKTAQMRPTTPNKPAKITANDYATANSNWYSIHHPITEQMIRTGNHTNDIPIDESVYYTRRSNRSESTTRALRDFHNLYVKSKLIKGTTQRNDTLIDFAVGRAGDLAKWRTSQLSFVLGVDISKDNIMHKTDGACVRYLNDVSKYPNLFDGVFFTGNSALNLRNGDAFTTHKEKKLTQAIFGEGPKVREDLGPMVHRNYGVAKDGFHVASCQFALHYFFENMRTLHGFARNVAECTRIGGTFIGTCWDGKRVFQLLERKTEGDTYVIQGADGDKMMEIAKMYSETGFPDDELSLGYRVNVYQESIGQYIPEYLVNFDFFVRFMENYGFVLAEQEDLARMGLPSSNASFEQLYNNMRSEIRQNPRIRYGSANEMTEQEQAISFLNRYFVFKKVRNVSTEKIAKLLKMPETTDDTDIEENNEDTTMVAAVSKSMKKKRTLKEREDAKKIQTDTWIRKLDKHVVTIGKYEPVMEEINLTKHYQDEINAQETVQGQLEPIQLKPAIAPLPKIVRTGKKLVFPKK